MREGNAMARIWSMMDIGKRSMANSQTSLQTVAHNIANKNTEGFSRQRVDIVANEPIGEGKLRIGSGARAGRVTRTNNEYLEKQIEREGTQMGFVDGRADLMGRVEQVYNEQQNKGLNQYMGSFFNSFRELSNNPESIATRTLVKESGDFLAKNFNHVTKQLGEIQADADFRISAKVGEVNQLTKEIAQLNTRIAGVEVTGAPANDERDRRDKLVKDLGNKVNIRYGESKSGELTITAGNTAILVSGSTACSLDVASTGKRVDKKEGNFDIFYKANPDSTPVNVTKQFTGGELGGYLQVRDDIINKSIGQIDELAYHVATEVNKAHVEGFDRYNKAGQLFFEQPLGVEGAAGNLAVAKAVKEDVGRIAAAATPDAPGDNRVANVVSALEYQQVLNDNTSTFDDYYNGVVGKIGVETERANNDQSSQKDVMAQLKNIRESISGVSLDEETTKMIEFQKGFDASARLIKTADEMMDTVLNLKRL
jgi:flagellar hook-associated protein 1